MFRQTNSFCCETHLVSADWAGVITLLQLCDGLVDPGDTVVAVGQLMMPPET